MANEVTIIVKAKNETKAAFAEARKDAEKLGTDMGDVIGKKITENIVKRTIVTTQDSDKVGETLGESIGRRIRDRITEHVKVAFERIKIDRAKIDVDVDEKNKTDGAHSGGTSRERVKVDVDVDESSRRSFLQRLADMGKQAGQNIREAIGNGISTAFSGDVISMAVKGLIGAILVSVGAPVIGAAFVGALLAARGGGVLAAGIASAFKDPRIIAGATGVKNKLSKVFEEFGKPFRGPLEDFLVGFSNFLDKAAPQFKVIADTFAPVVAALGTGFIGLLQNALPGVVDAIIASAPFFEMLAKHMPAIGQMLGDFFRNIGEHGPEATQFFSDLLKFIEMIIPAIAQLMGMFANAYSRLRALVKAIADFANHVRNTILVVVGAIQILWRRVTSSISSSLSSAYGRVVGIFSAIVEFIGAAVGAIGAYIGRIRGWLASLKSKTITISIRQVISTIGNLIGGVLGNAHGGVVGAATGGIHGGLRLVGEAGPELVQLPPGSRVHPTGATQRMMGGGGQGGSRQEVVLGFRRGADTPLIRAIMEGLRAEIRGEGGNVQNVLGVVGA